MNGQGTGFTIEVDKKQYLVTAKHIVKNIKAEDHIQIFHDNTIKNLKVSLVGHCLAGADVSVLSANIQLSPALKTKPTLGHILYGQDVYFLGFPYSLAIKDFSKVNGGFPFPFVKKAVLSNMTKNENFGRIFIVYLDGHNNKGFSGSPMIFREKPQAEYKIGAVISGYESETEDILFENKKTDLKYQSNTGIIIAYNIDCAIDVIKKNPIGFLLQSNQ